MTCAVAPSQERVLDVMQAVDGHRPSTAKKHYVLRNPAHDANLARKLVKVVFGEPVAWPDPVRVTAGRRAGAGWMRWCERSLG